MDKIFSEFCGGMQVVLKRQDSKKAEIALRKAEIAPRKAEIVPVTGHGKGKYRFGV